MVSVLTRIGLPSDGDTTMPHASSSPLAGPSITRAHARSPSVSYLATSTLPVSLSSVSMRPAT